MKLQFRTIALVAVLACTACLPIPAVDDEGLEFSIADPTLKADGQPAMLFIKTSKDSVKLIDLDALPAAAKPVVTDPDEITFDKTGQQVDDSVPQLNLERLTVKSDKTIASLTGNKKSIQAPFLVIKSNRPFVAHVPQVGSPWAGIAVVYREAGSSDSLARGWTSLLEFDSLSQDNFTSVWISPKDGSLACRGVDRDGRSIIDQMRLGPGLEYALVVGYHGKLSDGEQALMDYQLTIGQLGDRSAYEQWAQARQGSHNSKCVTEKDCGTYVLLEGDGNTYGMRCIPTDDRAFNICAEHSAKDDRCNDNDDCVGNNIECNRSDAICYYYHPSYSGGGSCCFASGTRISTPDGFKPIERIDVGDQVWSLDPRTREVVLGEVIRLFEHTDQYGTVTMSDGTVLNTTAEHPFFRIDWQGVVSLFSVVQADSLHAGDTVLKIDGGQLQYLTVASADFDRSREGLVYNFTVRDTHTYFAEGVLVHNK